MLQGCTLIQRGSTAFRRCSSRENVVNRSLQRCFAVLIRCSNVVNTPLWWPPALCECVLALFARCTNVMQSCFNSGVSALFHQRPRAVQTRSNAAPKRLDAGPSLVQRFVVALQPCFDAVQQFANVVPSHADAFPTPLQRCSNDVPTCSALAATLRPALLRRCSNLGQCTVLHR